MGKKIFVSYKYGDSSVRHISRYGAYDSTTVRDYVNLLQTHLDENDHINKGENDGEDMSGFKDETIASKLRDKIYDSSVTIVLISKSMKDIYASEEDQWIPWEVAYSLKEKTREDRTSKTNSMLAVVIPDENDSYEHFIQPTGCHHCGSVKWKKELLFNILGNNMFNRKQPSITSCPTGACGALHTGNDHSYIYPVKWDDFISNINGYIELSTNIRDKMHHYNIKRSV